MRLILPAVLALLCLTATPLRAEIPCQSNSDCPSGSCIVQEAGCGKKIVNNKVTLAATGKRLEDCEPIKAVCAPRPKGCAAVMTDGVIHYQCD